MLKEGDQYHYLGYSKKGTIIKGKVVSILKHIKSGTYIAFTDGEGIKATGKSEKEALDLLSKKIEKI